jgi:hypothetical protein
MLHQELLTPTYAFLPTGKVKVESKDDIKKRLGGRSTDRADALALAVYRPNRWPMGTEATYDSPASDAYWETAEKKRNTNLQGFTS